MAQIMASMATISTLLGISLAALALLLVWTAIWKGIALWIAARKKHLAWFIILLVVNTVGLLEILYIFLFSKLKLEENKSARKPTRQVRKKRTAQKRR